MRDMNGIIRNREQVEEEAIYLTDTVYLKTDEEQLPRIVTGIMHRIGHKVYELTCCTDVSDHFDFEISKHKNIL